MGTCSYVLTGTEKGMADTWGSTCHGAGRAKSRAGSRRQLDYTEVLEALQQKGISIRVASPKLVARPWGTARSIAFGNYMPPAPFQRDDVSAVPAPLVIGDLVCLEIALRIT